LAPPLKRGPENIGRYISAVSRGLNIGASILNYEASTAGRKAQMLLVIQDRILQSNAAGYKISGIDKQITASKIRIAVASKDIDIQQKIIDQANNIEDFLRQKYSNTELYS
jgi:hypothetical protein